MKDAKNSFCCCRPLHKGCGKPNWISTKKLKSKDPTSSQAVRSQLHSVLPAVPVSNPRARNPAMASAQRTPRYLGVGEEPMAAVEDKGHSCLSPQRRRRHRRRRRSRAKQEDKEDHEAEEDNIISKPLWCQTKPAASFCCIRAQAWTNRLKDLGEETSRVKGMIGLIGHLGIPTPRENESSRGDGAGSLGEDAVF